MNNMNLSEILDGVFDPGTEEYEVIEETYNTIIQSAPSISAEAKTTLILLDHLRTRMVTIYYLLSRKVNRMKAEVQEIYDAQYTRLVKMGRPSNSAIEAEIRSTNQQYAMACNNVDKHEIVKGLVDSYIRCIDSHQRTAMELLRNMNRID